MKNRLRLVWVCSVLMLITLTGCGYHTSSKAGNLPPDIHTIAVPTFINTTESYKLEQVMTQAVVRELNTRTNYHVVSRPEDADATLNGKITLAVISPLTFDTTTGRTSSANVTVTVAVKLVDKHGKVLFEQPSYLFRQEYEISTDVKTYFHEESPAVGRMAGDFAREFVSNVLEAF